MFLSAAIERAMVDGFVRAAIQRKDKIIIATMGEIVLDSSRYINPLPLLANPQANKCAELESGNEDTGE